MQTSSGEQPSRDHGAFDDRLGRKHVDDVQRLQPRGDVGEPDGAGSQRLGECRARRDRGVLPDTRALGCAVIALAGTRDPEIARPASGVTLVALERVDTRVRDRGLEAREPLLEIAPGEDPPPPLAPRQRVECVRLGHRDLRHDERPARPGDLADVRSLRRSARRDHREPEFRDCVLHA